MRAFIWILIFSGLISYGIKALIDLGFDYLAKALDISLSLNFIYYPITIIIMVIFEFIIALIYSQVACRYVSKKPILEILKDEK
jgi:TRAP-type C4-dicarboxylate transport system permease small subunit